jgi:hypothetical protein
VRPVKLNVAREMPDWRHCVRIEASTARAYGRKARISVDSRKSALKLRIQKAYLGDVRLEHYLGRLAFEGARTVAKWWNKSVCRFANVWRCVQRASCFCVPICGQGSGV